MDSGRIFEIVVLATLQIVGIVVYIVTIRGDVKALAAKMKESDDKHKQHFDHAEKDAEKFGKIGEQLAILVEQNKHAESNMEIMRQSFHEIRNAMSIVLGKAAVMTMTKLKPEDGA